MTDMLGAAPGRGSHRGARRRSQKLRLPLALTVALAASATVATTSNAVAAGAVTTTGTDALQKQFTAAAAEFQVPESVLLALSYQQSRWESHQGAPSTTGNYNVMGLTQVDAAAVTKALASGPGAEVDGRGDDAPAGAAKAPAPKVVDSPALHTLDAAAKLLSRPADELKTDSAQSIRGGAALLVQYQKQLGKSLSADPAAWYQAVARFSQSTDADGGTAFADRVFTTLRTGASLVTTDGQAVQLAANPTVAAPRTALAPRALTANGAAQGTVECPASLNCDFKPAAYALTNPNDKTSYGNYTQANRPADGDKIQYIVIHDTEGGFDGSIQTFQNPATQASAHYIVRSGDGHVTQLVNDQNIAWHAGNKTINMHSIGIEHEGYAFPGDNATWYSEQLYQSSATLVKYLAAKYNVPLDRQHIIGHDDVPGPLQSYINGMHWDPGTFWDWNHYMDLINPAAKANLGGQPMVGAKVTISPAFDSTNQPPVDNSQDRPQNFVYLRTQPDPNAPLINGGTTQAADWKDKAVAGTSFVVADLQGDWTAIWYGGVKAWFYNPGGSTAKADKGTATPILTPKAGLASIPVYGRTYPEQTAYAAYPNIFSSSMAPTPYDATIAAGQRYVSGSDTQVPGDFFYAQNIDGSGQNDRTLVVGNDTYFPIRFNHRLAFLKSTDVDVVYAPSGYTPFGPTRVMDTRKGTGVPAAKVGPGGTVTLQVTGGSTGIPSDATSVILNVTAVQPTTGGFVTVYPNGQPRPVTSNLNFTAGQIIPNLVVVPVVNGKVNFFNQGGYVDLVADITGYYSPGSTSKFSTTTPTRLLDTRTGIGADQAPVGQDSKITLQVAGRAGVPANATGVVLNVTATRGTVGGFVTVYPNGTSMPTVSNLNFSAGQTIPNLVIVPIVNGKVDLYNKFGNVDLIADITGYYTPDGASKFTSAGPTRLLDTRKGIGATQAPVGPDSSISLQVAGRAGLPATGVKAVVLNVTAVGASAGGFVAVYPNGTPLPTVSNLNFGPGQVIPNLVVVPVGADGKVALYNKFGTVNLVADITGYYTG
ncbi:N-acetylmuramoyl-L-alanine amidase [Kitasatospora sp. NPDC002227]|uniref:N-acetylmuramoyl-L-alanine amidase n=1 Tax=Kitasatospora sp. NPDC002227 TaxID=3154773 RepID=UPI00331EA1F1